MSTSRCRWVAESAGDAPIDRRAVLYSRERGIPFLDVVSLRVRGNPNRPPQRHPPRALVSDKLAEYLKRHGCVD